MKNKALSLTATIFLVSCVTVNIYFPAEEVQSAADKIVGEVWSDAEGTEGSAAEAKPKKQSAVTYDTGSKVSRSSFAGEVLSGGKSLAGIFAPQPAYAQPRIDVSSPEIRAIKDSLKRRAGQLTQYLDSGKVGITNDGMLVVRSTDGLNLKQKAEVNRLVQADNDDRRRLYKAVAAASGFPDKVSEVQTIFAKSWKDQAAAGWQYESGSGNWVTKR